MTARAVARGDAALPQAAPSALEVPAGWRALQDAATDGPAQRPSMPSIRLLWVPMMSPEGT